MTDWNLFVLAFYALISGGNPYDVGYGEMRYYYPIWTLFPLAPIINFGIVANALVSIIVIMIVTRKLGMNLLETFLVSISAMHVNSMLFGNIEWIPLLGFMFPTPIALLFFSAKPQAGIGFIIIALIKEFDTGGMRRVVLSLIPLAVISVVTIAIYGLPRQVILSTNPGNVSLFPYSLLIGIPAMIMAIKKRDMSIAGMAVFLSPYMTFHGYIHALLPLRGKWLFFIVLLSYVYVILGYIYGFARM